MSSSTDDWLETPGLARRTIAQMKALSEDKQWRGAVMLSFTNKRQRDNHARHMDNLAARYEDMKMRGRAAAHSTSSSSQWDAEERSKGRRIAVFPSAHTTNYSSWANASMETVPLSERMACLQDKMEFWEARDGEDGHSGEDEGEEHEAIEDQRTNRTSSSAPGVCSRSTEDTTAVVSAPQRTTPNEEGHAWPERATIPFMSAFGSRTTTARSPPRHSPRAEEWSEERHDSDSPYPASPLSKRFSYAEPERADSMHSLNGPNEANLTQAWEQCEHTSESVAITPQEPEEMTFEKSKPHELVCANPTVREKVRAFHREPTAAGKRYVNPLDRVENTPVNQLMTEIKYDKHRLRRWTDDVERNPLDSDGDEQTESHCRLRRRTSNPKTGYSPYSQGGSVRRKPGEKEMELFAEMHAWWQRQPHLRQWELHDCRRFTFPVSNEHVVVRVVGTPGAADSGLVTIVPPRRFDELTRALKRHVQEMQQRQPTDDFPSPKAMTAAAAAITTGRLCIVPVPSDLKDVKEYRRGWLIDGIREGSREAQVLLVDERRVMTTPLSTLMECPASLAPPPLCVTAQFSPKLTDLEASRFADGLVGHCRVLAPGAYATDRGFVLKLRFHRFNPADLLDEQFCSEECGGDCAFVDPPEE